jgi:hypothetical protein
VTGIGELFVRKKKKKRGEKTGKIIKTKQYTPVYTHTLRTIANNSMQILTQLNEKIFKYICLETNL